MPAIAAKECVNLSVSYLEIAAKNISRSLFISCRDQAFTDEVALIKQTERLIIIRRPAPARRVRLDRNLRRLRAWPNPIFFFSERAQPNLGCSGTKRAHTQLVESLSLIRLDWALSFHGLDHRDHTRILVKDRSSPSQTCKNISLATPG